MRVASAPTTSTRRADQVLAAEPAPPRGGAEALADLRWQATVRGVAEREAEAVDLAADVARRGIDGRIAGDPLDVEAEADEEAKPGDAVAGPPTVRRNQVLRVGRAMTLHPRDIGNMTHEVKAILPDARR